MAVDLQKLKRKMRGVTSTKQVTRALQMVSAMKMRKAQDHSEQSRAYRAGLNDLMATFEASPAEAIPELAVTPSGGKTLVVTFASDRGLCGPYNSNTLNAVRKLAEDKGIETLEIKALGIKVGSVLRRRGYKVLSSERRPVYAQIGTKIHDLTRELFEAWNSGDYREIVLVYSTIRGMTVFKPDPETWLPIEPSEGENAGEASSTSGENYIDEAETAPVLAQAVRRHLTNELLTALLQSEASEHVARMVAMDNATRNAEELYSSLQLTYNKARQAKITQEICEIVAGANAV
ncbi:MAG: ATP synthase F1 subunit gamma [Candidatus Omnitrophica bacterium]|nr:ATP synthase F1 subunit gamma [Candidatus Omnitrophota bacterium]